MPNVAAGSASAAPVAEGVAPTTWRALLARFQKSCAWRATWQLASTLTLYFASWALLLLAVDVSWWLALPLLPLTGLLLVRLFVIFHDATHGSLYASRRANDWVGRITGLIAFTPYRHWRAEHAVHHGSTGDLDRRGVGDVWTMTVREYLEASRWRRFSYRLARNPLILFGVAPFVLFLGLHRLPRGDASPAERRSVIGTNVALAVMFVAAGSAFGWVTYTVLQLAVLLIAGAGGIWLFYLQHQFENAYWERRGDWSYTEAALRGSSFLRLPKVLQWFSANIGFHHIHHLDPRIPNYHLARCHTSDPLFQQVPPMTLRSSLRSLRLRLWDEGSKKLVGFGHVRALRRARSSDVARGLGPR